MSEPSIFAPLLTWFTDWYPFLIPWTIWIVWWQWLVDWKPLLATLKQGGWIGLVLIGMASVLVSGALYPVEQHVLGIPLPNYWAKFTIVVAMTVVMIGCGTLQLSWKESSNNSESG